MLPKALQEVVAVYSVCLSSHQAFLTVIQSLPQLCLLLEICSPSCLWAFAHVLFAMSGASSIPLTSLPCLASPLSASCLFSSHFFGEVWIPCCLPSEPGLTK